MFWSKEELPIAMAPPSCWMAPPLLAAVLPEKVDLSMVSVVPLYASTAPAAFPCSHGRRRRSAAAPCAAQPLPAHCKRRRCWMSAGSYGD